MGSFKISHIRNICVMLLFSINKGKIATASCPKTSSPVLKMCENGEMRYTQIFIDGSTAAGVSATECRCTVLLHNGGQVNWSPLNAPGYNGCGTDLEISSTTQRINIGCHGGGLPMDTLPTASTINLTLHKPAELNSAADYCYRMSENSFSSDLTVRCCDPSEEVCAVDSDVTEPTDKPIATPKPIITTQQQTTGKPVTTQVLSEKDFPVEIVVPVVVIAILFCVATVVGSVIYVRRERNSMKDQTYDRHVTVAGRDDHQYEDIGQRSDYVMPS